MGNAEVQELPVKPVMERQRENRTTASRVGLPRSTLILGSQQSASWVDYCNAGRCSGGLDPSPTPNAGVKRELLPTARVRQQLCPAGMTACPVSPRDLR